MTDDTTIMHATTVAVAGRGLLIKGASGSGKSALALELIARGATLVADDRTRLSLAEGEILAEPPENIAGLIEARQVGLIKVPYEPKVSLRLAIDLDVKETHRLPQNHTLKVLGQTLPCLHKSETRHFPSAVLLYIKGNL